MVLNKVLFLSIVSGILFRQSAEGTAPPEPTRHGVEDEHEQREIRDIRAAADAAQAIARVRERQQLY